MLPRTINIKFYFKFLANERSNTVKKPKLKYLHQVPTHNHKGGGTGNGKGMRVGGEGTGSGIGWGKGLKP